MHFSELQMKTQKCQAKWTNGSGADYKKETGGMQSQFAAEEKQNLFLYQEQIFRN